MFDHYISKYKSLNLPGKLIAINVAIWVVTQVLRLMWWLVSGDSLPWESILALHSDLGTLAHTPWTLLTYSFVHANFGDNTFHLLFNMLWLWWFGQYFLRCHTGRQLLGVYLMGGLTAGLVFLAAFNLVPVLRENPNTMVVGASGAIFALVAAVAIRQPQDTIYLNFIVRIVTIRMKWFAVAALLINLLDLMSGFNVGGIVCHLGGMMFGFAFGLAERQGIDLTRHFSALCDSVVNLFKSHPRMYATPGGAHHVRNDRKADHDYNQRKRQQQERIDAILDKISKNGYDGLTAEEKAELFSASSSRRKN